MSKPKNWPDSCPYLRSPLHSKDLSKPQLQALRTKPSSCTSPSPSPAGTTIVPASATLTPSPNVKIQSIHEPTHPANGQHGLFAAQNLKPGSFIVAYLGRVHGGAASATESDYDLWLDREADAAVDAAQAGNEGRYVNDYRGVKEKANAVFGTAWCERWGQLCVGVWVVGGGGGGKKGGGEWKGIRKGEEILVSYGKGFWDERRTGDGDDGDGVAA